MRNKLLITGSGGFIGRNLVEQLQDKYNIIAPRSSELDLLDADAVKNFLKREKFDQVIHAAVYHVTRNSNKDPHLNLNNNLRMFFNLARCNTLYSRMFYFGSGAEYDKRFPIQQVTEEDFDLRVPQDDYGYFKYVCNSALPAFPNIVNLRLFGIFGKYEDWEIRFISNAICKVLFDMNITIKQNVSFDYLYINDLVSIMRTFLSMKSLPYQEINVCTGERVDLKTLAEKILHISGKNKEVIIGKPGFGNEYTAQNRRLKEVMKNVSFTPLDQSLAELYEWYGKHETSLNKAKLMIDP